MEQRTKDTLTILTLFAVIVVALTSFYLLSPYYYVSWGTVERVTPIYGSYMVVVNTSVMGDSNSYVFYFPEDAPEVGEEVTIDYKPNVTVVCKNRWGVHSFNQTGVHYAREWEEGFHEWHVIGMAYCSPGQCK